MANVKGNALPAQTSISETDILIIVNPSTGIAYRTTVAQFISTGQFQKSYYISTGSPYYSALSGGSITIPNFATDYPALSANGIVRMSGYITVDGTPTGGTIERIQVDLIPDNPTYDGSNNITSATFNFGVDPANDIIDFKLRMY